jgi:hypothetical protein
MLLSMLVLLCPLVNAQVTAQNPMNSTTLDSAVRAASADAARRTGASADAVEVLSAEPVTWRDGSLGCPQQGMNYTMALIPGYRIRLRAAGEVFDYHTSLRGALRVCPQGQSQDPLPDSRR